MSEEGAASGARAGAGSSAPANEGSKLAAQRPSNRRVVVVLALVALAVGLPAAITVAVRSASFETYRVPSVAMYPAVARGESVGVDKWTYGPRLPGQRGRLWRGAAPRVGDVVVFAFPRDATKTFVGRVVATAGERVRVLDDGRVERNGAVAARCSLGAWPVDPRAAVVEPFEGFVESLAGHAHVVLQRAARTGHEPAREAPVDEEPPAYCVREACAVPAGHVLTLGDHRDNAFDGRRWGFVSVDAIRGRVMGIMQTADPSRRAAPFDGALSSLWVPEGLRSALGLCRL